MRTILLCQDENHAALVDQLVFARLQEEEQAVGNGWSGVLTDGERFGILWAAPVSTLFGVPEDFPELVLVTETEEGEWETYVPAEEPAP